MNRPRPAARRAAPGAPPIETQEIEIMIVPSIRRAGGRHIRRRQSRSAACCRRPERGV